MVEWLWDRYERVEWTVRGWACKVLYKPTNRHFCIYVPGCRNVTRYEKKAMERAWKTLPLTTWKDIPD